MQYTVNSRVQSDVIVYRMEVLTRRFQGQTQQCIQKHYCLKVLWIPYSREILGMLNIGPAKTLRGLNCRAGKNGTHILNGAWEQDLQLMTVSSINGRNPAQLSNK